MKLIYFFIACLLTNSAYTQNQVLGKLKDSAGKPIEFSNILLYTQSDTVKVLKGTTSDSAGHFVFLGVNAGKYLVKVHSIGYKSYSLFVEKSSQQNLTLNTIVLENNASALNEVTISSKKELIQKTKTGFVINADATLSQQGGSAIDLLRNTPTVFVDGEGAINVRGKSPMILINGRNSKLANLNAIPANSIDQIELITSPGASYDAESENGIINIILKKGKTDGFNGAFSISSGAAYSWRLNNSLMLNYKKKQWNFGVGYDNRLAERNRMANGDRINFNSPTQYYLTQRRNDIREEGIHNIRSTVDYTGTQYTIGAEIILGFEKETNFETLFNTLENNNKIFQSKSRRFSDERRKENAFEAAFKYERKLQQEGQKWNINFSTSNSNGIENTAINTQSLTLDNNSLGSPYNQRTGFAEESSINNFRVDYAQKINNGLFETGYKGLLRSFGINFSQDDELNGSFTAVPNRTGKLNFNEWVNAYYVQYRKTINENWDYELGIRAEQTNNKGNVNSLNVDFKNNYFNLFPNANFGYKITNNQNIRFTYGKRINRPSLGQLNPFVDITDSLTQRSGNPNLMPEISHNLELGYSNNFSKSSIMAKVYYRNSTNSILPFTILQPNQVLFTQPFNAGTTITVGFETIFSFDPFPFWKSNWSASIFNQSIEAKNINAQALNQLLSWNTKWINDFIPWKKSKLQVIGVYNAPTATLQGNRIAVYNVDIAFQQKIGNDKARFGLIVTDIFNTQKNGFIWNTPDFNFSRIFKVDTRAVLLTFAYTFGTSFKEKLMENKFSND